VFECFLPGYLNKQCAGVEWHVTSTYGERKHYFLFSSALFIWARFHARDFSLHLVSENKIRHCQLRNMGRCRDSYLLSRISTLLAISCQSSCCENVPILLVLDFKWDW